VRTIFNILGPITNPAGAKRQIVGVFAHSLTETLCRVLGNLGAEDAMVVHGEDGLDEITITDGTMVSRWRDGRVESSVIAPEDFGFKRADVEDISGADKETNARITLAVLGGERGPRRDVVIMNSAAALLVAGKARDLREGAERAAGAIDSGRALAKLKEIRALTQGA
jgi:anthranilate phosphoribosyltransferase